MAMSVKVFDSLSKRDFENGAILDEIRHSLKELERISDMLAKSSEKPNKKIQPTNAPCVMD